ncbi:MAG TPA: class I SAM-dependent methyltransferase [Clostridiaceae bacterium]|nr:class I SAM-dependent methyltransferase [Clostridiaceae bacterium]
MSHYFDQSPESEHRYRDFVAEFEGVNFRFRTDSSVFSKQAIDYGTKLLIETVLFLEPIDIRGRFLDLGCGYGAVAVVFRKLRPRLVVLASDVNRRALELARSNLESNGLSDVIIIESDGLEKIAGSFDIILHNPPIRAGKKTVYRLLRESYESLSPGGRLYIVNRKKQGAASTVSELASYCDQVEVIKKKSGFWIIRCAKL